MTKKLEGVSLVREVIAKLKREGFVATFGESMVDREIVPRPAPAAVLETLRLDGGAPLSPCMREWLAFDVSFFGWLDPKKFALAKQKVGAITKEHLEPGRGSVFGGLERTLLPRDGYWVPFGDEAMRFVYPSKADAIGEYPVMLVDIDDMPMIEVGYPGIDVYLGHHAGLVERGWDERFAERMAFHRSEVLGGRDSIEYGEDDFPELTEEENELLMGEEMARHEGLPEGVHPVGPNHFMFEGDAPVPEGFAVVQSVRNPLTGGLMRALVRKTTG